MAFPHLPSPMASAFYRVPALLLSAFLQLASVLRVATTEASALASPISAVSRWIVGASAVAGGFHSVSGATGLRITPSANGTVGVAFGARVTISSSQWGLMRSFEADGLPPGIVMSTQGVFTGKPTQGGTFTATLTGWQNSNKTGYDFQADATFTITDPDAVPPAITLPPVPLTVLEGQPADFEVVATGNPSPTYQWTFEGTAIEGATDPKFHIASARLTDAGAYAVVVQNRAGSITSAPVGLSVDPAPRLPSITALPGDATVDEGGDVSFVVAAEGTEPLAFQWTLDDKPIVGANGPVLSIHGARSAQAGGYRVKVSNSVGEVLSEAIMLTVVPAVVPGPVEAGVPEIVDQRLRFRFTAQAGVGYVVESREAVGATEWNTLMVLAPAAEAGISEVTDTLTGSGRFYRIRPSF